MDPDAEGFALGAWEQTIIRDAARRRAEQAKRDLDWQQEFATRRHLRDGTALGASFVAVPRPDPSPGEPRFRLVRQG